MVREGSGLVLIHDAVRPLVESRTVLMVAQAARRWGGAVAAVPAVHTVKRVDAEGRVSGTPPREQLWFAHTPQGFRTDLILRAHREAEAEGFTGTDDAQLVERLGEEVRVVRDDRYNLKITTPEDLAIAEAIISWRAAHGGDSAAARDQSAGPRQS
jgi:2-C-methyl-D-erythritol 4-phosphate cytidylyltransferase